MTVFDALRHARERLAAAGIESAEAEAWWLLEAITGARRADMVVDRNGELDDEQVSRLREMLARRVGREPLQHIVGQTEFHGLEFAVDARALVPRPETERLVEIALERLRNVARPRVLDVGTGAGVIAVTIAHARPDADVMATDLSAAALELARANGKRHGVDVRFVQSHLLDAPEVAAFARTANALVTNPPYLPDADRTRVSPEVGHDPELALYGGSTGVELFLELADRARALLPTGSELLAELDPRNVREALRAAAGWETAETATDLLGRERFLLLRR